MPKKSLNAETMETTAQATPAALSTESTQIEQVAVAPIVVNGAVDKMAKARKARSSAPKNESKHDKLVRLANQRVTRACKYIQVIGNLAGYKPSESEINMIMQALGESCASVSNRLNGVRRDSIVFTLR